MRKRHDRRLVPLLLAVTVVAGVVAASAMAASSRPTVKVMPTASLGKLLATSSGLTLYHYTDEKGGKSKVTTADVMQSNGVIHVVDSVLMPK